VRNVLSGMSGLGFKKKDNKTMMQCPSYDEDCYGWSSGVGSTQASVLSHSDLTSITTGVFSDAGSRSQSPYTSSSRQSRSPAKSVNKTKVVMVDDFTSVPESVFQSLLQAAKKIEDGGQHRLVCEVVDGDSSDISSHVGSWSRDVSGGSEITAGSSASRVSRQKLVLNGVVGRCSSPPKCDSRSEMHPKDCAQASSAPKPQRRIMRI